MALILRENKGSKLTIEELDGNFTYLQDSISSSIPYKTYRALITQTGTNDPTSISLQDDLGDVTFHRYSTGYYAIRSSHFTTATSSLIFGGAYNTYHSSVFLEYVNVTEGVYEFTINSLSGGPSDDEGSLNNFPVQIYVY